MPAASAGKKLRIPGPDKVSILHYPLETSVGEFTVWRMNDDLGRLPMSNISERSVFLQALDEESPEAREAFLAQACAGDEELRASVEKLLKAHELDNPLDQPIAELKSGQSRFLDSTTALNQPKITEQVGAVIGPYKLMEQIGEGGFGLVFVAEQQQPIRRRVALKLIKPGMDTRDVIARFEAERQALALMDHQNIASVFDAGTTDSGRPYFVMELVRGIPMTEFCDQQQLEIRTRLELFVTVCNAMQHAHQKGVIHRDIKPTNVLVTLADGAPVVKVIDFGVAKAIGQSLTDKTIYTRFAVMIGTPLYMSPEQAEMGERDIDTRSDIYSLGVLLYELLTGTTPFDRERLNTAGFDEVRRIIREENPPKPSTRLTTLCEALSTSSAIRGKMPRTTKTTIPGDLDWIVMKALEKDRRRRYESAGSLAADVRRFLGEEPVEARPPSQLYRMSKFARRNKVTLITASLVAAAMILGTAISVWQAARAISARNDKELARQQAVAARSEADEARKQVEEFAEGLTESSILVTSGRAHADADRWAAAYADYSQAIQRQPNYYYAWFERASLEVRLGLWKRAAEGYSKALQLGVPADNPANWGIPQLFLFNGDEKSYREYCLGLLKQSEQASRGVSVAVVRSCVIAVEPVTEPIELANRMEALLEVIRRPPPDRPPPPKRPLADSRDAQKPRPPGGSVDGPRRPEHKPPNDPQRPRRERPNDPRRPPPPSDDMPYVAGLAHYRAGQFDDAIVRLRQAMDDPGWRARSIVYPGLAMAYHRSGQADEAKEALASAEQAIEQWTEEMLEAPIGRMPIPWLDWIECQLLYREATILLTGFTPSGDPRLRTIEQRALAAIQDDQSPATP